MKFAQNLLQKLSKSVFGFNYLHFFVFSLVVRLLVFFLVQPQNKAAWTFDSVQYYHLGKSWFTSGQFSIAHAGIIYLESLKTPAYPTFLYGLSESLGFGFTLFLQIVLASLLPVLFLKLSESVNLNPKFASLGAVLLVLSPVNIVLSNSFLTEVTFTVFVLISFWFALGSPQIKQLLLAALLLGLATLIRPSAALLFPLYLAIVFFRFRVNQSMLFTLFYLLAVGPWLFRNYVAFDRLFLSDAGAVVTLFYTLPKVIEEAEGVPEEQTFNEYKLLANQFDWKTPESHNLYIDEVKKEVLNTAKKYPIVILKVLLKKSVSQFFALGRGHFSTFFSQKWIQWCFTLGSAFIIIFLFFGNILFITKVKTLFSLPILYSMLAGVLLYLPIVFTAVDARFRQPVEVFFMLFACLGYQTYYNKFRLKAKV
jgi:hypothetical protein